MLEFKCTKSDEEIIEYKKRRIKKKWDKVASVRYAFLPVDRNDGTGRCFWLTKYVVLHDKKFSDFESFHAYVALSKSMDLDRRFRGTIGAADRLAEEIYDKSERKPVSEL